MGRPIKGQSCKLYIDLGVTADEWIEAKQAKSVTTNRSKTAADVSARYTGTNLAIGGMKSTDISFDYVYIKGKDDSVLDALEDSYYNDTPMRAAVADGDVATAGTTGQDGAYECFTLNMVQELDGAMMFNVVLQPTYLEDTDGNVIEPRKFTVGTIEPQALTEENVQSYTTDDPLLESVGTEEEA